MNKIKFTLMLSLGVLLSSGLSHAQSRSERKKKNDKEATAAAKTDSIKKAKPAKVTIAEKIKTSKKVDGMFTIYQDTITGSIQLFIKKDQLGKEFIYQSYSMNGPTTLFLNQSMHRATNVFNIKKNSSKY